MTETVTVTYAGAQWRVVGTFYPADKGDREQPDEPATFEAEKVFLDQNAIDLYEYLTDEAMGALEAKALEQLTGEGE